MHARILIAVLLTTAALAFAGQSSPAQADKSVTISPTSGFVGTVVTAKLRGAPPADFITVIFKGMSDPILATGTTDASGAADFTFTIPYALSGTYSIFFTDFKCSCQIATDFTVTVGNRTPTPVPTSTPAPTSTPGPSATPATATAVPTATPTQVLATPVVPVLGTGGGSSGPGFTPQPGLYGLALLIMAAGFAFMNAGQIRNKRNGPGGAQPLPARLAPTDRAGLETEIDCCPGREAPMRRSRGRWMAAAGGVAAAAAGAWLFSRRR